MAVDTIARALALKGNEVTTTQGGTNMKFTRRDTFKFMFKRLDANGDVITVKANEMWFTVKENYNTTAIKIQKKLSSGEITYDKNDYTYHVTIQSGDTAEFNYNQKYVYDVQVQQDYIIKTIVKGTLEVTPEVTFEGVETNE